MVFSKMAMVARESGKPCVVGTKHPAQLVQSGQKIEVDGASGTVSRVK